MSSARVLKSPYPWFGGKSRIMDQVWSRFGDVRNFVDPFLGSCAALLCRPTPFNGTETVNDLDGFAANFWRAVQADPEAVARYADWPVNENDLHARHSWLVARKDDLQSRLEGDPEWFDAKVAGWWVWGISCWIGSGWCSGSGPWHVVDGRLVKVDGNAGRGVKRKLPHLGNAGQGVNRKLPHLGNAGRGVNRQHNLRKYISDLSSRFARVRVCCGDWSRVCGSAVTTKQGLTAVFLDPPYSAEADRDNTLYRRESTTVAHAVREWAIEHGDDPMMRIALCGYEGEHVMPDSWECLAWKAHGGYGSQSVGQGRSNARRERIWFSPHCLKPQTNKPSLFTEV